MENDPFIYSKTKYLLKKLSKEKFSIIDKEYYMYSKSYGLLQICKITESRYTPTFKSLTYEINLVNTKTLSRHTLEFTEDQLCEGLIKHKTEWMKLYPEKFI